MAFLTVEDLVGTVEVVVFPRDYEKWQTLITDDARVFIQGRVNAEDDRPSKLILEKVHSFEDIPKEVWIQFRDKAQYSAAEAELQSFLKDVPGTSAVVIYLKDVKAMKRLPAGFRMQINEDARVFIQGRVNAEDDKPSKLILEKVRAFDDIPREIWIQFKDREDYAQKEQELLNYLRGSVGTSAVVIYLKDVKAIKRLPAGYHVQISEFLIEELKKKYGDSNVKVVERVLKNF